MAVDALFLGSSEPIHGRGLPVLDAGFSLCWLETTSSRGHKSQMGEKCVLSREVFEWRR